MKSLLQKAIPGILLFTLCTTAIFGRELDKALLFDYPSEQYIGMDSGEFEFPLIETNDAKLGKIFIYTNASKVFESLKVVIGTHGTIERMVYTYPANQTNVVLEYFQTHYSNQNWGNTVYLIKYDKVMMSFQKWKYYASLVDQTIDISLVIRYSETTPYH